LFTRAFQKRAEPLVLGVRERGVGRRVEQSRDRGAGRVIEKCSNQVFESRASGILVGRGREIDETGSVVLPVEQAAFDHDLEQFSNTGWTRRLRKILSDLFDRGPAAPMNDLHDLAFAASEMNASELGHFVKTPDGDFFRHWRIYSPSGKEIKRLFI